jgi:hypothetical protein
MVILVGSIKSVRNRKTYGKLCLGTGCVAYSFIQSVIETHLAAYI